MAFIQELNKIASEERRRQEARQKAVKDEIKTKHMRAMLNLAEISDLIYRNNFDRARAYLDFSLSEIRQMEEYSYIIFTILKEKSSKSLTVERKPQRIRKRK